MEKYPKTFSSIVLSLTCTLLLPACYPPGKLDASFVLGIESTTASVATTVPRVRTPSPTLESPNLSIGSDSRPSKSSPSSGGGGGGSIAPSQGTTIDVAISESYQLDWLAGRPAGDPLTGDVIRDQEFSQIGGIAILPGGRFAVCDRTLNRIVSWYPGEEPENICGTSDGRAGYWGENIPALASALSQPTGLSVDETNGAIYVADSGNHRIRYFIPDGYIYTIAGGGQKTSNTVSIATDANIGQPHGLALDSNRNLYFSEIDTGRVRRIAPEGSLTTLETLIPNILGDLVSDSEGKRLWITVGSQVRLLNPTSESPSTLVWDFQEETITSIAFDQLRTIFLVTNDTFSSIGGARVWQMKVSETGQLPTGQAPVLIAGFGPPTDAEVTGTLPSDTLQNAKRQPLNGPAPCALVLDLYARSSPSMAAGDIVVGTFQSDLGWGQLARLRLTPP